MPMVNIGKMRMRVQEPAMNVQVGMIRTQIIGTFIVHVQMVLIMAMAVVVDKFFVGVCS